MSTGLPNQIKARQRARHIPFVPVWPFPRAWVAAAIFVLTTGAAPAPPPLPGEAGVWIDDTGKGAVEIRVCGDRLCGNIVWLQNPLGTNGKPLMDGYNPEVTKRTRAICGLPVIGDLRRQSEGGWDEGWIYDPKVGESYDVAVRLVSRDRLQVTGYKGLKIFSKTFTWNRAPADLPRCPGAPPAAPPVAAPKKAQF